MGIRPLYWYKDDKLVAFVTDMRGILSLSGIDKSLDDDYLYANIMGWFGYKSTIADFVITLGCEKTVLFRSVYTFYLVQKGLALQCIDPILF